MRPFSLRTDRPLLLAGFLFALSLLLLCFASPHVTAVDARFKGTTVWHAQTPDERLPTPTAYLDVRITLDLGILHPSVLQLLFPSSLKTLAVNDVPVPLPSAPVYAQGGFPATLGAYLHAGTNTILATVDARTKDPYTFLISATASDPLTSTLLLCITASALVLLWQLLVRLKLPQLLSLLPAFGIGMLLRVFYVFATPFPIRAYDWEGHIDYIRHLLVTGHIPPAAGGWEFFQPPLSYTLSAAVTRMLGFFGTPTILFPLHAQTLSLLFSLAALAAALWAVSLLFRSEPARTFATLLIAVLPGLLYPASQISNDGLTYFLLILAFALMLQWWQAPTEKRTVVISLILALGILTKSTALPHVGIFGILILLRKNLTVRQKGAMFAMMIGLLLLLTGWLFVLRFGIEGQTDLSGNIRHLNRSLRVENVPRDYLVFNPLQVLAHPFNITRSDAARRAYFWEYFFRSIFFEEWTLPALLVSVAWTVLLPGLLAALLAVLGAIDTLRKRNPFALPLLVTTLSLLLSVFWYRATYAFSPLQSMRYVPVVLLPLAAYAVMGAQSLPRPLRTVAFGVLALLTVACAALIAAFTILT